MGWKKYLEKNSLGQAIDLAHQAIDAANKAPVPMPYRRNRPPGECTVQFCRRLSSRTIGAYVNIAFYRQ
ncbi:hypothetical protein [Sporomusa termitida]|uniref:hypothetical protein n=1 Tax=Sporomusa termitida TaxID=2377 RepID=UPI001185D265|nr:hypothetical protein [Sporomusa termitida]